MTRATMLAALIACIAMQPAAAEAAEAVLAACAEYAADCVLYAVDDHLAQTANAGSR
jgi:hypothetical protein